MPVQSDKLMMAGLGVLGDQPPIPLQPPLADGIHLRWAFDPDRGFPWWGYYLFRRPHRVAKPRCLAGSFPPSWLAQTAFGAAETFAGGRFSSDAPLAFTDDFSPQGRPEVDLRGRTRLRFDLPAGQVARELHVQLGFLAGPEKPKDPAPPAGCLAAPVLALGNLLSAILSGQTVTTQLKLTGFDGSMPVTTATLTGASGEHHTAVLAADRLTGFEVEGGLASLLDICLVAVEEGIGADWGPVPRFPYPMCLPTPHADYPCAGKPGGAAQAETVALSRIHYGPAAAWAGARFQDLSQTLSGLVVGGPPPIGLPMADRFQFVAESSGAPDPPAMPQQHPLDLVLLGSLHPAVAMMVGLYWIDDPDLPATTGPGGPILPPPGSLPVEDLTPAQQAASGVAGEAIGEAPAPPIVMPPLDSPLAEATSPDDVAAAEPVGQASADAGQAYDYLLLADHGNTYHGDSNEALASLAQPLPATVDAWVCYNLRKEPAAPLAPPADLNAFALPGGATDPAVVATGAMHAAGLRWRIDTTPEGELLPRSPVGYHVWRAGVGAAAPSGPTPSTSHGLITADSLVIAGAAAPPPAGVTPPAPAWPSDWPAFPMMKIDAGLAEGWYSYRVNGVDIYGRFSTWSDPAEWRQWAPPPTPKPWYYIEPPADRRVHQWAVELRDTQPPPKPVGVSAQALDPDDPDLDPPIGAPRNALYDAWKAGGWWASLPSTQQNQTPGKAEVLGLRVSWMWTAEQIAQAPDTKEFRIYVNPGTDPPAPDYSDRLSWQTRAFVVPYAQHVTIVTPTNGDPPYRRYEVWLPIDMGQTFTGAPLSVSELKPIDYANVGVSAADNSALTGDDAKWVSGLWGGRTGNEGAVAGPVKVFRVLRERPPAPAVVDDSDKVWATRADYANRSFYTVRWPRSGTRKAHIFRAMDDTLFRTDWERRRTSNPPPLTAGDPNAFPIAWWDIPKRSNIAAELALIDVAAAQSSSYGPAVQMAYALLGNDSLRVLAGLPGNEAAFTQATYEPLDPALGENADRVGPDGATPHVPDPTLCAWLAELDGKAGNRYFFRSAYANTAHTVGPMGPSSPPVYLPKVQPPRIPTLTKVVGGDRSVQLAWASNRDLDLAEYRLYRTQDKRDARDVRLMTLVGTASEAQPDPSLRPREVLWSDAGVPGSTTLYYRLTTVDAEGNESTASPVVAARAFDLSRPAPPVWDAPEADPVTGQLDLSWTSPETDLAVRLERSPSGTGAWTRVGGWLARGTAAVSDTTRVVGADYDYRLRVMDASGRLNDVFNILTVPG